MPVFFLLHLHVEVGYVLGTVESYDFVFPV